MQRIGDRLVFSPSDLNHFLECEHLIQLERHQDPRAPRAPRDAHADLLAEKGAEHERAWLDRFRTDGKSIVTIESGGRDRDWAADAERTRTAMRSGADVIYQAAFADDEWHGVSDFLVRVERPSALGPWSYEAWDTKLARHTKPYFVLQPSQPRSDRVAESKGDYTVSGDPVLDLALLIDATVRRVKPDDFRGHQARENTIKAALLPLLNNDVDEVERIFLIIKAQHEY